MKLVLKTVLINGEDPDPQVWQIGFGTWPQEIEDVKAGLTWIWDIYCTHFPDFEDYSILIQAPPDDAKVYINVSATFSPDEKTYVLNELWEIVPDETPV